MSLLDDARQLVKIHPLEEEGGRQYCRVCGEAIGGYPDFKGHESDCPWLSMSKIVAALEAAEMVTIAYEEERIMAGVVRGSQFVAALEALDTALDA